MPRSTTNRNQRGNSADRRRRKQYLLDTYGDGTTTPCHFCQVQLTFETLTVDRIKSGVEGGTYRRENCRPACAPCNYGEGGRLGAQRKKAKKQAQQDETGEAAA